MMIAVLQRPRRLPRRYNRPISSGTRALLRGRQQHKRRYAFERWKRWLVRMQRRLAVVRQHAGRVVVLLLLSLVPIAIGVVLFSPVLRLQKIAVDRSNPRVNVERVVRILSPLFGERLFFVSSSDVVPLLQAEIPDLAGVEVHKSYPDTLSVSLAFDPIVARLQIVEPTAGDAPAATSGAVLGDYLTEEGVLVSYAAQQVGTGAQLPLVRLVDWGVRPVQGTFPFDPKMFPMLLDAERALTAQFGHSVVERTVYVRAREFHVRVKEYELWFDLRSPLQTQLQRYRLFLKAIGKQAAKLYVDLRLSDRVVYK